MGLSKSFRNFIHPHLGGTYEESKEDNNPSREYEVNHLLFDFNSMIYAAVHSVNNNHLASTAELSTQTRSQYHSSMSGRARTREANLLSLSHFVLKNNKKTTCGRSSIKNHEGCSIVASPAYKYNQEHVDLVWQQLERLLSEWLQSIHVKDSIGVFLDGVAPVAKMKVQQTRRKRDSITKKSRDSQSMKVHSLMISPGTYLMYHLVQKLKLYVHSRLKHLRVYLSDCSVPGEGEQKLIRHLLSYSSTSKSSSGELKDVFGIVSPDSDVLLMAMCTKMPNVLLFANQEKVVNVQQVSRNIYHFLIQSDDNGQIPKNGDYERVLNDFTFLSLLNGNDYQMEQENINSIYRYMKKTNHDEFKDTYLVHITQNDRKTNIVLNMNMFAWLFATDRFSSETDRETIERIGKMNLDYVHTTLWVLGGFLTGNCPNWTHECTGSLYRPHLLLTYLEMNVGNLISLGSGALAYSRTSREITYVVHPESDHPCRPAASLLAICPPQSFSALPSPLIEYALSHQDTILKVHSDLELSIHQALSIIQSPQLEQSIQRYRQNNLLEQWEVDCLNNRNDHAILYQGRELPKSTHHYFQPRKVLDQTISQTTNKES